MAYDKVIDSAVLNAGLLQIADAIREKGGTSGGLAFPTGMAEAIAAIEAGGGKILGHDFVAGSFTLSEDTTATYTILSADELLSAFRNEFPGIQQLSSYVYCSGGSSENTLVANFIAAVCWIDTTHTYAFEYTAKEWLASFLPRASLNSNNNALMYADSYKTFAARSGSSNGIRVAYDKGVTVGFNSSYIGLAGSKYNWLVWALDHGEVR